MSLPDQTPKLPKLPFLIGDVALLATAWFLVHQNGGPLSVNLAAIVAGCVALGAILGALPFFTDYARKQDEALDERQRGLDALSRTITTAAEQISIAANGLHQITEIAHKNVKQAEQLPHKLQEKIAEFNAQLDNAREDDREELEKELTDLRASESERLATVASQIHKAVAELTKLDASAQKHITARTEVVERAEGAAARVHADAAVAASDALAAVTREFAAAQTKALAAIEAKLADRGAAVISAIETAASKAAATLASPATTTETSPAPAVDGASSESHASVSAPGPATVADVASPPKRPRKLRRDDVAPAEAAPAASVPPPSAAEETSTPPTETAPALTSESLSPAPEVAAAESGPEPAPVPVETIRKIEPVAPASADPFESTPKPEPAIQAPAEATPSVPDTAATPPVDAAPAERPAKKRAPKKPANEPDPMIDLPLQLTSDDASSSSSDDAPITAGEAVERVISSDGLTRLIATAYIGIGNRLFIRGDGPGLSWEKGVPLQFISIGKWRWETPDASAPIRFKLLKNDEMECPALGELTLDPGHQQEVTAKF